MHKMLIIAVFAAAAVAAGMAGCRGGTGEKAPRNPLATAEETVKAYCDLDAQGARLTSTTWPQVLPYIDWTEEAGGDWAYVIGGFRITGTGIQSDRESTVTVEYDILGRMSTTYTASKKKETVRFTVARTERGWKITAPDTLPLHVSQEAMVKHLEETKRMEMADRVKQEPK